MPGIEDDKQFSEADEPQKPVAGSVDDGTKSPADASTIPESPLPVTADSSPETLPETLEQIPRPPAAVEESGDVIGQTIVVHPDDENVPETLAATWTEVCDEDTPLDATVATQADPEVDPAAVTVHVTERTLVETAPEQSGESFTADPVDYELRSILGKGGMGAVWQARQSSIDRSVALKMTLDAKTSADKGSQKFLEEAMITGALEHPNIVPIYDLGRAPDGRLFYVMKQVQGDAWKDKLHEYSLEENLRILLRACDAVAFANSRGVIHRDLKPENIMLGEFGEVLVMDWGLALVLDRHDERNSSLGGTPGYMAPEMATGPIARIGTHSDIYLLGAILFELVTGRKPHFGNDVMACLLSAANNQIVSVTEGGELLDIALKAMATNPRDRHSSVKEFQSDIRSYSSHQESIAFEAKAVASLDEAEQTGNYQLYSQARFGFQSAIDLWDGNSDARDGLLRTLTACARTALEKGDYELGLSVLQPDVPEHETLRLELVAQQTERNARQQRLKAVKRTSVGLAMGIVVVMLVAIVLIRSERDLAQTQKDRAEQNFKTARAAVDQMLTEVGEQQLQDVPQMEPVRRSLLQKALGFYSRFLEDQPDDPALRADTARAYHRVADISRMLGQDVEAGDAYRNAIEIFDDLVREFPDKREYQHLLADSHNWLGELLRSREKTEQAETHFQVARDQQLALIEHDPGAAVYRRELARTAYNLGLLYWQTNRPVKSREAYDNAVKELNQLVNNEQELLAEKDKGALQDRQELARAYLNRGILNRSTKMPEEARSDYDAATTLLKQLSEIMPERAEYRLELAAVLNNLGNLLVSDTSRREETEGFYREGLVLVEALVADFPNTPLYRKELANAINSLAALHYYNQESAEAETLWTRSRGVISKLLDEQPDVPEYQSLLARTLGNLGTLKASGQKFDEARDFLTQAVENQGTLVESYPDNPDFRRQLATYVWILTESHLALQNHVAASRTAVTLAETMPDNPAELYRAATLQARCLPMVDNDDALPTETKQSLAADYQKKSLAALSEALDQGWIDREKLEADSETVFAGIRDSPEFQRALTRLSTESPE